MSSTRGTAIARPAPGQVRVRRLAVGESVPDIAGVIDAVGAGVIGFFPGDPVAYRSSDANPPEVANVDADVVIGVPHGVSFEHAATYLTPGIIARAMLKQVHPVRHGDGVYIALNDPMLRHILSAWAVALGGHLVDDRDEADIVYDKATYRAAIAARYSHGQVQQAASDVYLAVRRGVFDRLPAAA